MVVDAPAGTQAPLLYRTAPFSKMESARRFQLLWQARAVHYSRGEQIFSADAPPSHVLLIFEGGVSMFGELPAEPNPVLLDELGPGACAGWSAALAGVPGVCAVATGEVDGLLIPAPAFLEITRYDPALKEAIYSKAWRSEVWRSVLWEMERQTGQLRSARAVVDTLMPECVARDWPEEEAQIAKLEDYVWVVVGGEGVKHGERWNGGDGVLWARLIGLPELKLNEALIVANALATVEPDVSPSRNETAPTVQRSERGPTVSSSEVRFPAPAPSRVQTAPVPQPATSTARNWWHALSALLVVLGTAATGAAWWASTQEIYQTISLPGRIIFAGETRPLQASVAGTLAELNVQAGQRVQPGAVLGIVRPPFDEGQLRALHASLLQAQAEAAFCEDFLVGRAKVDASIPAQLVNLAREHARLGSEVRVLAAIARGGNDLTALTLAERQRVAAHFAGLTSDHAARLDTAARDASTRGEDLREAEEDLREAQEEVRLHQQSFSGARTENKKEAAQELADYRRVLGVLQKRLAARQAVVGRLQREIKMIRAEAEPVAPVLIDDTRDRLARANSSVAAIEEQFRAHLQTTRTAIAETEESIARLQLEAAPRQILARAPGLVSEASSIALGADVGADTTLAQFVTRELWQVECPVLSAHAPRLQPGQRVKILYTDKAGNTAAAVEPLVLSERPGVRVRLNSTRDEWRDGMPVQLETDVSIGSLLDQWLGRI